MSFFKKIQKLYFTQSGPHAKEHRRANEIKMADYYGREREEARAATSKGRSHPVT